MPGRVTFPISRHSDQPCGLTISRNVEVELVSPLGKSTEGSRCQEHLPLLVDDRLTCLPGTFVRARRNPRRPRPARRARSSACLRRWSTRPPPPPRSSRVSRAATSRCPNQVSAGWARPRATRTMRS